MLIENGLDFPGEIGVRCVHEDRRREVANGGRAGGRPRDHEQAAREVMRIRDRYENSNRKIRFHFGDKSARPFEIGLIVSMISS